MVFKGENEPAETGNEKCRNCGGCVDCNESYCIYNSHGNPENCSISMCGYCTAYLRKQRLFLGNVG